MEICTELGWIGIKVQHGDQYLDSINARIFLSSMNILCNSVKPVGYFTSMNNE
jgi:hypothetical protein